MNGLEVATQCTEPDISAVRCAHAPSGRDRRCWSGWKTILPDVVPVFMSGYSDKEYLKAAIKLKAVNYIEKPLDPAGNPGCHVMEARDLCLEKKADPAQCESIHSMESASRLALLAHPAFRPCKGKH